VLAIVASGFAESREGVLDVLDATFYAHETDESLAGPVDDVVADLVAWGMLVTGSPVSEANGTSARPLSRVERSDTRRRGLAGSGDASDREDGESGGGGLAATDLGRAVSRQYVAPRTGARIVSGLRSMREMETVTGLTALEVVCDTPDMHGTYLGNRERATMYQYARSHADELTTAMADTEEFERWLEAVKTARILLEWADGVPAEDLVDRYRIGPGDLESRIERAEWLLGAAAAVAETLDADGSAFRAIRERL
jgi:helicase